MIDEDFHGEDTYLEEEAFGNERKRIGVTYGEAV
jgi:hypothetical protein